MGSGSSVPASVLAWSKFAGARKKFEERSKTGRVDGRAADDSRLVLANEFVMHKDEVLGTGAYSVVYAGHRVDHPLDKIAVKCIDSAKLSHGDLRALDEEVRILKLLNHPNIVNMLSFIHEGTHYYIIMEKVNGGELFDRIVQKSSYNEKEAKDTTRILLGAIQYLHDRRICHRDLKPENLLLKSEYNDTDLKIADFGFAAELHKPNSLSSMCGTPGYVAPEVINVGVHPNQTYGLACDMWSVGVIVFVLLGGYPPFDDDDQGELFRKIQSAEYEFHYEYWSEISDDAKDLIASLLVVDTNSRMTVHGAMGHPWFKASDEDLQSRDLSSNLERMQVWNEERKKVLKGAVQTVIASSRFRKSAFGAITGECSSVLSTHDETTRQSQQLLQVECECECEGDSAGEGEGAGEGGQVEAMASQQLAVRAPAAEGVPERPKASAVAAVGEVKADGGKAPLEPATDHDQSLDSSATPSQSLAELDLRSGEPDISEL